MAQISKIRSEELSVFYYIKDYLLTSYIEKSENVSLVYSDELSSVDNDADLTTNSYVYEIDSSTIIEPYPYERGRGWVYFDAPPEELTCCSSYIVTSGTTLDGTYTYNGTPEQSSRIFVYDSLLSLIPDEEYMLDYKSCRVITSGTCSPAYIDYYWNYVSVLDEWEEAASVHTPMVVVDISPNDADGYQLGGGRKVTRTLVLYIFASSQIERKELADLLFDGFYEKSIPIYKFNTGTLLDYDGTWYGRKIEKNKLTSLFDRETVAYSIGNMYFEDVKVVEVRGDLIEKANSIILSDVNRYRSKIVMDAVYYT